MALQLAAERERLKAAQMVVVAVALKVSHGVLVTVDTLENFSVVLLAVKWGQKAEQ